ncbi:hypothetical protein HPB50_023645 [Hyalomma asiaticum]|uniref:Uncharacterized protein n=1 Tax=Hyalomma asiaticum TaxID=266040 RepID=A0ACB7T770_HYAAI|nr:hypothetical protein HPB50_023645 [Hyalomma asiaticum]
MTPTTLFLPMPRRIEFPVPTRESPSRRTGPRRASPRSPKPPSHSGDVFRLSARRILRVTQSTHISAQSDPVYHDPTRALRSRDIRNRAEISHCLASFATGARGWASIPPSSVTARNPGQGRFGATLEPRSFVRRQSPAARERQRRSREPLG